MIKKEQIFIVGSSRSGTTMLGRILNKNQHIKTLKELHFFGTLYTNQKEKTISKEKIISLLAKLLCIEDKGIFNLRRSIEFQSLAKQLISESNISSKEEVLQEFFRYILKRDNVEILCEQTPRNIFYLKEIFNIFPDPLIINMVRDPRDVMLSQKNKWKRRFLGAKKIPLVEAIRSYINYNPILIAKFWRSSIIHSQKYNCEKIHTIQFEDLVDNPQKQIQELCFIVGVRYNKEMLLIPNIGSSGKQDEKDNFSIDNSKIKKWEEGNLNNAEIYICQLICGKKMKEFNYSKKKFTFMPLFGVIYFILLPIQLILILAFNLNRMKNIFIVIQKRLF